MIGKLVLFVLIVVIAFIANMVLKTVEFDPTVFSNDLPDMNTSFIKYVTVPTYSVNLQVIEIGENDPNKPLLLFLHGFPETALMTWHKQLEHFANMNKYYILAPDMRGYNKSDKPANMMDYYMSHLVSDVHALISKYAGRKEAYIVAHDW
jgi:pimeloyl-ACP methyl ester carboxylesterase